MNKAEFRFGGCATRFAQTVLAVFPDSALLLRHAEGGCKVTYGQNRLDVKTTMLYTHALNNRSVQAFEICLIRLWSQEEAGAIRNGISPQVVDRNMADILIASDTKQPRAIQDFYNAQTEDSGIYS